jgi:hypothetical protein
MTDFYISLMRKFMETECPMPGHWCNGNPIPVSGRRFRTDTTTGEEKKSPCKYHIPGKGCTHPANPKYNNNLGKE